MSDTKPNTPAPAPSAALNTDVSAADAALALERPDQLLPRINESIKSHWQQPALSDFRSVSYTYAQLGEKIQRIHMLLKAAGIVPGDRVCLCAKNSAAWAFTFLGTLTYGCVVVPLLHEFHPETVEKLVTHSEGRLLFTEKAVADKLDLARMPLLEGVVLMPEFAVPFARDAGFAKAVAEIPALYDKAHPGGLQPADLTFAARTASEVALINYTSGSTGNPKGVMLTYGNLWSNIAFGIKRLAVFGQEGTGVLSMLPLAHMYGLAFEFLYPLCLGAHITFLGRVPSPKVVLDAFQAAHPKVVITVPLVIEKIIKAKVFPQLRRPLLKILTSLPVMKRAVYNKIKRQLLAAFGGEVVQVIIGGAAMSKEVEEFLRIIRFPFTIGYGMTECAPLITYEPWDTQRPRSCGRLCDGMQARVASDNPEKVPGTLYVKGDNVMKGYYKNPEDTAAALDADGWLNTGDICTMDRDGYIYINGRDKNMILSASGQNIYPEEIEVVLNNMPLVGESVVVEREGKLVALVHPDYEAAKKEGLTTEQADESVKALLPQLNAKMPAYSKVAQIVIQPTPFEKTPKQSIRRFLYK